MNPKITSFAALHAKLRTFGKNRNVLFRGHNDADWDLIPKIGRPSHRGINTQRFYGSFKRRALHYLAKTPEDDWDWMALAQHHGLPTHLLDWSFNPMVAAFFAAFPFEERDCAIFCYSGTATIDTSKHIPTGYTGVGRVVPKGIASRIVNQSSWFTYHNPPFTPLSVPTKKGEVLEKLVISARYRSELIFELDQMGFNKLNLFPDLDGLSAYMSWSSEKSVRKYWT